MWTDTLGTRGESLPEELTRSAHAGDLYPNRDLRFWDLMYLWWLYDLMNLYQSQLYVKFTQTLTRGSISAAVRDFLFKSLARLDSTSNFLPILCFQIPTIHLEWHRETLPKLRPGSQLESLVRLNSISNCLPILCFQSPTNYRVIQNDTGKLYPKVYDRNCLPDSIVYEKLYKKTNSVSTIHQSLRIYQLNWNYNCSE